MLTSGLRQLCFCVGLTEAQAEDGLTDHLAGMTASSALEAGSDKTASTLAGFLQAMVLYPAAQRSAQASIDRACGDRFPSMADMDNPETQYIRACVKESLRWMPTAILGVQHAVTIDDEYMGYKIPKGAAVV